ncbi:MAG: DUF378 domain-containing protein [Candidatus Paceibacterota bacterium]
MLSQVTRVLVIVGGVNWGLVGLGMLAGGNWNVVNMILGSVPTLEAVVYVLVGLAAVKMVWPR